MIQYFNFGVSFLAMVCLGATLYYLWMYRKKEDERLAKGFNAFIFSLGFLELFLISKTFVLFITMFWSLGITYYFNLVADGILTPLVVLLMLTGVMLFREV